MAKRIRVPPALHDHYKIDPNPNREVVLELAKIYGLSKKRILRFFQNKRFREFKKLQPSKPSASTPVEKGELNVNEIETAPPPVEVDPFKEFWERMAIELQ